MRSKPAAGVSEPALVAVTEPTFESFMADLERPSAWRVDGGLATAVVVPLRPTVGARALGRLDGGGMLIAAAVAGETLAAGERRVLRVELGSAAAASVGAWLLPEGAPHGATGLVAPQARRP